MNKQMNYLIQERLNKRFQSNSDLIKTFEKYTIRPHRELKAFTNSFISPQNHDHVNKQETENQSGKKVRSTKRYRIQDDVRQSIPNPLEHKAINNYSFLVPNKNSKESVSVIPIQTESRDNSINKSNHQMAHSRATFSAEADKVEESPPAKTIYSKIKQMEAIKIEHSETKAKLEIPSKEINKPQTKYLKSPIKVENKELKEFRRLTSENSKLGADLLSIEQEKTKLFEKTPNLQTNNTSLEVFIKHILASLDIRSPGEIIQSIEVMKTKTIEFESKHKTLVLENEVLKTKCDDLEKKLSESKIIDNKDLEIEMLVKKGNSLQDKLNKLIDSLDKGSEIATINFSEFSKTMLEENEKLKLEIDQLEQKLVTNDQEHIAKEDAYLNKIKNDEINLKSISDQLASLTQNLEMEKQKSNTNSANEILNQTRNQLEQANLALEVQLQKSKQSEKELKEMINTLLGENDLVKKEYALLSKTYQKKMGKIKKQEIKFFEISLRTVFLSSEVERLRSLVSIQV